MDQVPPPPPEPLDESPPSPATPAGPGWKSWLVAGAVAGVVVIGGLAVMHRSDGDATPVQAAAATTDDAAATGGPSASRPGGGTGGEITAVDGTTFTIESTDQSGTATTYTVETDGDTTVTESTEGTLDDLAVGDNIVVMGETVDGAVAARTVIDSGDLEATFGGPGGGGLPGGPPADGQSPGDGAVPPAMDGTDQSAPPMAGGPGGGFTAGTVTAVEGTTITVEATSGESVKVTTSAETTVQVTEVLAVDDLEVGDSVRVSGTTEDTTIIATTIRVGDAGFGGGRMGGRRPN